MIYQLSMRDDAGGRQTAEIEAESLHEAITAADEDTTEWVEGGDWGPHGASVNAWWTLSDADGDEVETGSITVEIEPDHDALIHAAGGDVACEHDWTQEGEGGDDHNPGVFSVGPTRILTVSHCRHCGLRRRYLDLGAQRDHGEHDTVSYEQSESWCVECGHEECDCD